MTVWELVQQLTQYSSEATVKLIVEMDTVETLQVCSEDSGDGKSRTTLDGNIDGIESMMGFNEVVITVDAF
jgi:hypothetical protein